VVFLRFFVSYYYQQPVNTPSSRPCFTVPQVQYVFFLEDLLQLPNQSETECSHSFNVSLDGVLRAWSVSRRVQW